MAKINYLLALGLLAMARATKVEINGCDYPSGSSSIQGKMGDQIRKELQASYMYERLSINFYHQGMDDLSKRLKVWADEERDHANKMAMYMTSRGYTFSTSTSSDIAWQTVGFFSSRFSSVSSGTGLLATSGGISSSRAWSIDSPDNVDIIKTLDYTIALEQDVYASINSMVNKCKDEAFKGFMTEFLDEGITSIKEMSDYQRRYNLAKDQVAVYYLSKEF